MKAGRGRWLTKDGRVTVVVRLRSLGPNEWCLDGAIQGRSEDEGENIFGLSSWDLEGGNDVNEKWDLVRELT